MVISTAGWLGWICKAPEILQWRSLAAGLLLSSREYVIFATWHYGFWVNFSHEINIFFFPLDKWTSSLLYLPGSEAAAAEYISPGRYCQGTVRAGFSLPLSAHIPPSTFRINHSDKTLVEGFPTGNPSVTEGSLQERRRGAFYRNM